MNNHISSAMLTRQIKVLVLRQTFFKHLCKQKSRSHKGGFQAKQSQTQQPKLNWVVGCSAEHPFWQTFTILCISVFIYLFICLTIYLFITVWFWQEDPDLILPLSFTSCLPMGTSSLRGLGYLLIHHEPVKSQRQIFVPEEAPSLEEEQQKGLIRRVTKKRKFQAGAKKW